MSGRAKLSWPVYGVTASFVWEMPGTTENTRLTPRQPAVLTITTLQYLCMMHDLKSS